MLPFDQEPLTRGYFIEPVEKLVHSPDGKHIALMMTNALLVHDAETFERRLVFEKKKILTFEWSPSGKYLAISWRGDDTAMRLLDGYVPVINILETENFTTVRDLPQKKYFRVTKLAWSKDEKSLVFNETANELRVQHVFDPDAEPVCFDTMCDVTAIQWHDKRDEIFVGTETGGIQVWNSENRIDYTIKIHDRNVFSRGAPTIMLSSFVLSPDQTKLVYLSDEKMYIVNKGEHMFEECSALDIPMPPRAIAWSPDSTMVAFSTNGVTLNVYHVETKEKMLAYTQYDLRIITISWSPDGKDIVVGGHDAQCKGVVQVYDVSEEESEESEESYE